MINRLSNLINRNRSAAKISQVLCSNIFPSYSVSSSLPPKSIFAFSYALGHYASLCLRLPSGQDDTKTLQQKHDTRYFFFFFHPGPLCLSMPQVAMIAMWSVQCLQRSESDYAQFDNHHHHHHHYNSHWLSLLMMILVTGNACKDQNRTVHCTKLPSRAIISILDDYGDDGG